MLNDDPITNKAGVEFIRKSEEEFRAVLSQKKIEEEEGENTTLPNILQNDCLRFLEIMLSDEVKVFA